ARLAARMGPSPGLTLHRQVRPHRQTVGARHAQSIRTQIPPSTGERRDPERRGHRTNSQGVGESVVTLRLVMMGTGNFAEPTFEALLASPHAVVGLVTQPDRAVGQERGSTRQTGRGMKAIAVEHGVAVFQPESINTPE